MVVCERLSRSYDLMQICVHAFVYDINIFKRLFVGWFHDAMYLDDVRMLNVSQEIHFAETSNGFNPVSEWRFDFFDGDPASSCGVLSGADKPISSFADSSLRFVSFIELKNLAKYTKTTFSRNIAVERFGNVVTSRHFLSKWRKRTADVLIMKR